MTIIEIVSNNTSTTLQSYSLTGMPSGGVTGQSLVKASNTDYDVEWDTALGSGDMLRSIYDPNQDGKIAYASLSGLPVLPAKLTVINTLADFPIQDATTITLDGGSWLIGNVITTSKRFILINSPDITSASPSELTLTYTGTGDMFTSVNQNFSITSITYSCPNGRVFNCSGTGIWLNERTSCVEAKDVGIFTGVGFSNINFSNFNFLSVTGQGMQLFGTFFVLSLTKMFVTATSPTFVAIDLGTSLCSDLEFRDLELYAPSGAISLKGTTSSANITANRIATVKDSTLNGGSITPLSGITISDIRWDFKGNSGVEDTLEDALIYFNNNALVTNIINSSNDGTNAVNVNAVWSQGRLSKFSFSSDGAVTYLGERPITVPLDATLNIKGTTGTVQEVNMYITLNNNVIAATHRGDEVTNTRSKQISTPWQITLYTGDVIRLRIENETSSADMICTQGVLRIR